MLLCFGGGIFDYKLLGGYKLGFVRLRVYKVG